jgi:hypothetical protein
VLLDHRTLYKDGQRQRRLGGKVQKVL